MKMKSLALICFFGYSFAANAAITKCSYNSEPCDQYGNHYDCVEFAWTGPDSPKFCSPDDRSNVGKSETSATNFDQRSLQPPPVSGCYPECGPDEYCAVYFAGHSTCFPK